VIRAYARLIKAKQRLSQACYKVSEYVDFAVVAVPCLPALGEARSYGRGPQVLGAPRRMLRKTPPAESLVHQPRRCAT
jgi:hypothetical protein